MAIKIQYRGPSSISSTNAIGMSGSMTVGWFAHSKTMKRENSAFEAKNCDLYVSNQRMVLIWHGSMGGIACSNPLASWMRGMS